MEKEKSDLQKNANTILLTLVLGGIGWLMHSVEDLNSKMAVQEDARRVQEVADDQLRRAVTDQGNIIGKIDIRLVRIEDWQFNFKNSK